MPMKKRFQKKRPAVKRKRAYKKSSRAMVVPYSNIIPDRTIVRLPYIDIQNINQVVGSGFANYSRKTYYVNSIYDPEPNAVNTTTMGWSEWSSFYQRYRVIAMNYEVTLFNSSADTMVSGCLYFQPWTTSASTTPGDPSHWLTQPRSRKFALGNRDGGKSTITLKGKISCPSLLGMTNEQYRVSEDTCSEYSAQPNRLIGMNIQAINTNSGINGGQIQASVKLTYVVELFQRVKIDVPGSLSLDDGEPTLP